MLKSMTGFGRCEIADKDRKVIVEMKSVNHRYCDITIKMPKKLSFFESAIRSLLKKYIQRGKVDIFITYEDYTENRSCLKYNRELAAEYMDALRQMSEDFSIENDVWPSATVSSHSPKSSPTAAASPPCVRRNGSSDK